MGIEQSAGADLRAPLRSQPRPPQGRLPTTLASSDDDPSVTVSYTELVASGGAGAPRAAVAVRPRVCEVWAAPGGPGSMGTENRPLAPVAGGLVDGAWYYQTCSYSDTGELGLVAVLAVRGGGAGVRA